MEVETEVQLVAEPGLAWAFLNASVVHHRSGLSESVGSHRRAHGGSLMPRSTLPTRATWARGFETAGRRPNGPRYSLDTTPSGTRRNRLGERSE
jgi:hypothetical protein